MVRKVITVFIGQGAPGKGTGQGFGGGRGETEAGYL